MPASRRTWSPTRSSPHGATSASCRRTPLPWLYRAAHFAVANQRRTLARRGRLDDRARLQTGGADALDHSDRVAADLELAAAFRALSEADREVLRLAAWEGLGPAEIGVVVGCSAIAAKARLRRARQRLSRRLGTGGSRRALPSTGPGGHDHGDWDMNDLDDRLAAWNPVRAQDMLRASSSADATRLLHRILSQPILSQPILSEPILSEPATSPPGRRPRRSGWQARAWIAGAAAVAAAIAVIVATIPSAGHRSAGQRVVGFQHGPSLGLAASAVELVDYATRSAASTSAFVPGPRDWAYFEKFYGLSSAGGPDGTGEAQTWQQVGTRSYAASWHHGELTYGAGGGPGARLIGWPGTNWTTMYQYLASLPARPAALRKIILANNDGDPAAAFTAVENLFGNFPVSARFQAELYAVLVSLPGVGFAGRAVDAAGRPGIGLYLVQDSRLDAVIVNPRTYVYMGGVSIAVQGHPSYDALLANPGSGTVLESTAILNSGIVGRPGQAP